MKGLVFTEFLEMVEQQHGFVFTEKLIDEADLPSGGAYTSVGTYDHAEMVKLLTLLSEKTDLPIPALLRAYGHYLFRTFERSYPQFLENADSAFAFLKSIDEHIHVEVKKLYPDAELPAFSSKRLSPDSLELIYTSERKMGPFAQGLIEQSLVFFYEKARVSMENIQADGSVVRFTIEKTFA
jgi:hypothetical protein